MDEPNVTRSTAESLGAELRKQREIRGISLKEIADATKISRRYLEALETDEHGILPAPVFTRGFVREFARYIGLDAEQVVDRYNEMTRSSNPDEYGDDSQTQSQPLPLVRVDRNVVVFGLMLVAFCVVVWWVWSRMGASDQDEPVTAAVTETIEPAVAPPSSEPPPEAEPAPVNPEPDKLELRVAVKEDTWVILQIDGKVSTNEVLRAGDVRTFTADNEFRFEVVGNAGGIDLTLNGHPVAPLGASGRVVRNVVFDWTALEGLKEGGASE